jgi:hypothetical protein
MDDRIYTALVLTWCFAGIFDTFIHYYHRARGVCEGWDFWFNLVYCISAIVLAGIALYDDPTQAGFFLICAAISGWMWWRDHNNRKKRKRLADKAAGVVADVGGRLRVVQPPQGSGA